MNCFVSACPKSWMRHENSCYQLRKGPEPWEKAKETCISLRSQLATISSSDENNFIASMVNDCSWIGVQWNETVMGYAWVDGSAIDFSETWKNRQNDSSKCVCIREKGAGGDWNQLSCLQPCAFVCEKTGRCWNTELNLIKTRALRGCSSCSLVFLKTRWAEIILMQ